MTDIAPRDILDNVSAAAFRARLEELISDSHEYEGTLPETWEDGSSVVECPGLDREYDEADLTVHQIHQVETVVRSVRNTGASKVVLEAAHLYMDETLDDEPTRVSAESQLRIGSVLTRALEYEGVQVGNLLFVDNYNVAAPANGEKQLDIDAFVELGYQLGYNPSHVLYEADMVDLAKEILKYMDQVQGLVSAKDEDADRGLFLQRKAYELYRDGDGKVSCAMLDAALTILKFRYLGDAVVNILPIKPGSGEFSYRSQQRKMRTIISEHLGVRSLPQFNMFVGVSGEQGRFAAGRQNQYRKNRAQDRS